MMQQIERKVNMVTFLWYEESELTRLRISNGEDTRDFLIQDTDIFEDFENDFDESKATSAKADIPFWDNGEKNYCWKAFDYWCEKLSED